ncbi:hypothetical protein SUGI_0136580 [Cryptomeria japonica]|nr:hypothetical protein SUGI_0136580 [Cryptomeria japonica]
MRRILLSRKLFNSLPFRLHNAEDFRVSKFSAKCRELSQNLDSLMRREPSFARGKFECSYAIQKSFLSSQAHGNGMEPGGGIVGVPLAQTGEGIAECELLKWFVQEGDRVDEFQPLCEVQSDKATIEITSRYQGKVSRVKFTPGDIVKVGETLVDLIVDEKHETVVSLGHIQGPSTESQESGLHCRESPNSIENREKVLATPAVRQMAKEYGINLEDIPGTGKDGRVLKEDVLKYVTKQESVWNNFSHISHPSQTSEAKVMNLKPADESSNQHITAHQVYEDKTILLRGFQRTMVKTMNMAAKVPHFHYLEEINVDSLVELKKSFQGATADQGVKHTYMPFLIKSLSFALMDHPSMNSIYNEEAYELVYKGSHNIGVAMATPHGLVVPNIKNVQSLSILEITKELQRLIQGASNNRLSSDDVSGGTITVSNFGAIGGKFGSPLLNLPEVSIIAIGRIQKLPRFSKDGTVYPASLMNVIVGADHRVIDGAAVAKFCNKSYLQVDKTFLPETLQGYQC